MKTQQTPLRAIREKKRLTLQELAVAVESDVGNLSRIERGTQTPSKDLAAKICAFFKGKINEIQLFYPERFVAADGEAVVPAKPYVVRSATDRRSGTEQRKGDRRATDTLPDSQP